MTTVAKLIATLFLVTRASFTSAILAAKGAPDSPGTSVRPSEINNRQAMVRALSASVGVNQAADNGVKLIGPSRGSDSKISYLYLNPSAIEFQLPLKEVSKTPFDYQRYRRPASYVGSSGSTGSSSSTSAGGSRSSATRGEAEVGHGTQLHQGSSYQVVEELDEYVTVAGDSGDGEQLVGYRGKVGPTYQPRRDTQELTAAIKALDHFLSGILNGNGYNSPLHPPNNPALALVLSRYGRYVPVARKTRVYAYNAANNVHNNQPFGKYKQECEDEPIYVNG